MQHESSGRAATGWASWGHMSEVNPGATVLEVTGPLTNQGSGFSQGLLGTDSDQMWDGLFLAAQEMEIQSGLVGPIGSLLKYWALFCMVLSNIIIKTGVWTFCCWSQNVTCCLVSFLSPFCRENVETLLLHILYYLILRWSKYDELLLLHCILVEVTYFCVSTLVSSLPLK